jgi:hypothetical protein
MTDRAPTSARAVAKDDGPSPARELAQRRSGTVEVLLLWHPKGDRVELAVRDLATDASFHIDIAPGNAIDAFYHPYAYAARPESSYRVVRAETTDVDGSR